MVQYEISNSSFFVTNQQYCEAIEEQLKTIQVDCKGYCNSYGYDINAEFTKQGLNYKLRFYQHQSTQNGVVLPVNAIDTAGTEITLAGLRNNVRILIGRSYFRRFLLPGNLKKKLPAPFFLSCNYTNGDGYLDHLLSKITEMRVVQLKLAKGKLKCSMHLTRIANPLALITDIEMIIEDWR